MIISLLTQPNIYSITVKGNKRLHELIKEWESFTEAINSFMKESDIHE